MRLQSDMIPHSPPSTALVVETNYLIASVIEAPLLSAGYQVAIAADPDEAFALLDTRDIGLALIDFRLQHGEPEGLVALLRQRGIPFIFCTAASVEEVFEHFPNTRVMLKPFSDQELLTAVAALVSDRGSSVGA
ncbi:response regulator [Devosia sp. Root413D1]|uniref:response regulator n=1 Tax=Devosia sp. Root413D1 TaxID=1736531 RepID=UPI000A4AE513|nr:response regulator [Devosia sp. Root413D1]